MRWNQHPCVLEIWVSKLKALAINSTRLNQLGFMCWDLTHTIHRRWGNRTRVQYSRTRARLCPHIEPAIFLRVYRYAISILYRYSTSWHSNILYRYKVLVPKLYRYTYKSMAASKWGHLDGLTYDIRVQSTLKINFSWYLYCTCTRYCTVSSPDNDDETMSILRIAYHSTKAHP